MNTMSDVEEAHTFERIVVSHGISGCGLFADGTKDGILSKEMPSHLIDSH